MTTTRLDASSRAICRQGVYDVATEGQRAQVADRANNRCETCGVQEPIELHHLTYRGPAEPVAAMDNLFALCEGCHAEAHELPFLREFQKREARA